jgi:NAD(P)H dehydrogenase (quinone)
MTKILIVYATNTGNTKKMAEAVASGANSVPETEVILRDASEAAIEEVRAADAIILGSPLRHRSADSRVKKFIEETIEILWLTDEMVGKTGGVFTTGGGYGNAGAGVEIAQLGMLAAFAGVGMVLVTLPKTTPGAAVAGSHWGAHGRTGSEREMLPIELSAETLECAFHHGANVARVAARLVRHELFARGNVAPTAEVLRMFMGGGESETAGG